MFPLSGLKHIIKSFQAKTCDREKMMRCERCSLCSIQLSKRGRVFSPEMKTADKGSARIAHTVPSEPEGKGERSHEPQLFF